MSEITRKGLELIINTIGRAKNDFISKIGNTSKKRAALLDTEKLVVKLRGSSIFHDYDFCQKDPITGLSTLPTFDVIDNVGFGIQGGKIKADLKIGTFKTSINFNPALNSPPSPEGWSYYDYNAWSNYIPPYNSSGIANSNFVIYGSEPSSGSARTNYSYPVKYSGSYSRVPLFNCARYVSINNGTFSPNRTEFHLIVNKNYFDGVQLLDPLTNTPLDLGIYYHPNLFTNSLSGTLSGSIFGGESLIPLPYSIYECNQTGLATSSIRDHYFIKIKYPSSITNNIWSHLVFYFGTHDFYFQTGYPSYSSGIAATFDYTNLNTSLVINPKKSFFKNDFNNYVTFEKTGINDNNVYLFSINKTHYNFIDGEYSEPIDPFRYKINETIVNSSNIAENNSLLNYANPEKFEFIAVCLATKNSGILYETPSNEIVVFYTSPMPFELIPSDWSDFNYYPSVPSEYDVICKIILQYPDSFSSGTCKINNANQQIINNCSISYIEMVADNFAKPVLGNSDVASYLFSPFYRILQNLRNKKLSVAFDVIAYSMIPYASGMNINNFRNVSQFSDENLNYYKMLHSIVKRPINELLKNSIEPYALQLEADSLQQISDWAILSPSTNIATLYSNELLNNKITLPIDSEFEIYQEESFLCEAINPNLSGNKVGQDYTFRLKFETLDENYLIKDLYVNNSTFFLTDQEYQNRLDKNLSVIGYYKQSTLTNMDAYRLYGYAGVIPDLAMIESRLIDTKVVNPIDNSITSEDYVPDSNKYSNKFVTIKDLGVSVSQYSYSSEPYWTNNFNNLIGCLNIASVITPEAISDIVADSFTIASFGYDTADGSINYIENICDYKNTVDLASTLNQLTYAGVQNITDSYFAVKISPAVSTSIKSFKIKLLKTTNITNQYSYVECQIWNNSNGLPGTKLTSGSKIYLDDIDNIIADYEFNLFYDLKANNTYWLVFSFNKFPSFYDSNTTGLVNVAGTAVTGVYDYTFQTYTNFTKYNINSSIGFGSTSPSLITNWYTINGIGSSSTMTIDNTGTTLSKQNYAIKHKLQLGIQEASIGSLTPFNLATYNSTSGWSLVKGTAYIEFFVPTLEVLGAFNRTISGYDTLLPPPNTMRSDPPSYQVDGYWSYTCKTLDTPSKLSIYPRSIYLTKKTTITNGFIGNNYIIIGKDDFPNGVLVGMIVTDNSASGHIATGTVITKITYDDILEQYTVYLSSNILANFSVELITFGEDKYIYLKRSRDIHLIVRYYKQGILITKYILLEKSANWTTKWYQKTNVDYSFIDEGITSDIVATTSNLTFSNYDVNGQTEYINGVCSGVFVPENALAGNTYTFRIQCSGGYRLYLNGSSVPESAFDNWTNTILSTSTGSITVTSPIEFRLEFSHTTGSQYLSFEYNDGSGYKEVDASFYQDPEPEPYVIDDEPIEKLAYLVVGKTYEEINTPTNGAPPGDRLVFRNK
jgi:hypothetical protein